MTEEFSRVQGPDAFTTWEEAEEAGRFLAAGHGFAEGGLAQG